MTTLIWGGHVATSLTLHQKVNTFCHAKLYSACRSKLSMPHGHLAQGCHQ